MVTFLSSLFANQIAIYATGAAGAAILLAILKKIPTDKFSAWSKKIGAAQGLAITTFFNAKLPKFWNGVIEPVIIDNLNAIGIAWLTGFISGLKSDNPGEKNG